jgi:hypothetical protein
LQRYKIYLYYIRILSENLFFIHLMFVDFGYAISRSATVRRVSHNVSAAWGSGGLTEARAGTELPNSHCRLCGLHPPLRQTACQVLVFFLIYLS